MIRDLVRKNRSYRNFNVAVRPTEDELKAFIELTRYCGCGMNRQVLRYRIILKQELLEKIHQQVHLAAMLKDKKLPYEGKEPGAYILICGKAKTQAETAAYNADCGIAMQTILLGAVEQGYGGCIIGNFNKEKVAEILQLDTSVLKPMYLLALGKPEEKEWDSAKEEWGLDPLLEKFLEADTCDEKLTVLELLAPKVTDQMINTMAIACDLEIEEDEVSKRLENLKNCLKMKIKYESVRLR